MNDRNDLWNIEYLIKDMLFDTDLSFPEMAKRLGIPEWQLHKKIREYGLGWVRKSRKKMSRGHETLYEMMCKLLPGEEIVTEFHIGERLMLDIYCPTYELAAEYHGRQHFHFSSFFFDDIKAFKEAQARDERKIELCREKGIGLLVFRFDEKLNEDAVFDRMVAALRDTPKAQEENKQTKYRGEYYEAAKQRQRNYRRDAYREWKQRQKKYDERESNE